MGGGKICTDLMAKRIGTCVLISVLLLVCIYIVAYQYICEGEDAIHIPLYCLCLFVGVLLWEITGTKSFT